MPKAGEVAYLDHLDAVGIQHAVNKPFSDPECGQYLIVLGAIRNLLPPPPAKLLDLGCGTGWTSCLLGKMGYEVVGQDIAENMIHYANVNRQSYQLTNVKFEVSDYEGMGHENSFDCCLFFDSLHHAEDERLALEKAYAALKPGGVCITREPGTGHAEFEQSVHAVEQFNVTEKDMPPHKILAMAKAIGFKQSMTYPYPDQLIGTLYQAHRQENNDHSSRRGFLSGLKWFYRSTRRMWVAFQRHQSKGGLVVLTK